MSSLNTESTVKYTKQEGEKLGAENRSWSFANPAKAHPQTLRMNTVED